MTARLTRVKIAPRYADLKVEPTGEGVRLMVGTVHVHLTAALAHKLADALVDAAEQEAQ